MANRNWTHKVVRRAPGMDGKMFDYPTAATFTSFEAAVAYCRDWLRGQPTLALSVRTRKAVATVYGRTNTVATFHDGRAHLLVNGDWVGENTTED